MADNLLKEEELFAWQIDVFDNEANRIRNNRKRKQRATDFTVQLRIETEHERLVTFTITDNSR